MSLKSMIELDVGSVFLSTEDFAEPVEVWYHYQASADSVMVSVTALVDLPSSSQQYNGGDRNVIRGTVYLPSAEFEKAGMMPGACVRTADGVEHLVRRVSFVVRGSNYRIESVGEAEGGMLPVQVTQGIEQYSNPRELDPI